MKWVEKNRERDASSKKMNLDSLERFGKSLSLLVSGKTILNLERNHEHYKNIKLRLLYNYF